MRVAAELEEEERKEAGEEVLKRMNAPFIYSDFVNGPRSDAVGLRMRKMFYKSSNLKTKSLRKSFRRGSFVSTL